MQAKKMAYRSRNVYLVKTGGKPVGGGSQEICKNKESNLDQLLDTKAEIIQSKLYFRLACILQN